MIIKVKNLNESFSALITKPAQLKLKIAQLLKAKDNNCYFVPAYKQGIWDGFVKFYTIKNDYLIIPKGFLDLIKEFAKINNIEYKEINPTKYDFDKEDVINFINSINLPFEIRDYQKKAILVALYKGRGIFEMATGSGKSVTQAIIAAYLWYKKGIKTVLIVPNVSLVEQFYSDFLEYFKNSSYDIKNDLYKIFAGKEKHFDKPITITTWQSIYKSEELFEDIGCIIIDEVQKAKNFSSKLSDIIIPSALNAKYKFGFTGSIPKDRVEQLSIIGTLGKIYSIIKAKDLIEMGFGTPIEIILLRLKYNKKFAKEVRKLDYHKEKKLFEELPERTEYIVNLAKKATNEFGNTLILFNTIKHGYSIIEKLIKNGKFIPKLTNKKAKELQNELIYLNVITEKEKKLIEKYNLNVKTLEEENIFFIYGDVDANIREEIRKKVENKKNCIIVANYATFSTGINIKNLHNLIFASSVKSFITIVQSLGRTIRKHNSKEKVRIFDIIDDCSVKTYDNHMMKHFKERLSIYLEEGHIIKEKLKEFNISDRRHTEIFGGVDIINGFF